MSKDMPKEVKDAINVLFDWLNKMGMEKEVTHEIIEAISEQHRTLKQNFMRCVIVPLIYHWAEQYENKCYDLRNESTCKTCFELRKFLEDKYFPFI